ncbi:hypothetical protein Afil01_10940 [Actinorhabdospora filicis]|uniref:histidine kinase n=1 Tax=Actinorhabdospora filicis TaxID=1785913 RepID=A0A9W6SHY7_9ACTN|nr:histidine kinase [Actinorhabdospora filicis]GLZ76287.1 hypothetical protein Afil01_10940 [Actinorhabdospora filicis]
MISFLALLLTAGLSQWNGLGYGGSAPVWRVALTVLLAIAAYYLGRRSPNPRDHWALWTAGALSGLLALIDPWHVFTALAVLGVLVTLPWLAGRFRRQQAELVSAGRDRVAALERERALIAAEARLRERERIAADTHDSLGHELALLALRAGLLELAPDLPREHRASVADLRAAAGRATESLRETIGLLRAESEPLTPVDEPIADLVERARAAGLAVAFTATGAPVASRAAHRVVQEALTNAAKHAPGAPVTVSVTASAVEVANPVTGASPAVSGGRGLIGLDERVRLAGGSLRAAAEGGVFTVRATFPEAA